MVGLTKDHRSRSHLAAMQDISWFLLTILAAIVHEPVGGQVQVAEECRYCEQNHTRAGQCASACVLVCVCVCVCVYVSVLFWLQLIVFK